VNNVNINDKTLFVFSLSDTRVAYRIIAMFTIAHLQTPIQGVLSFKIYLRNNNANVRPNYSVNKCQAKLFCKHHRQSKC